MTYHSLIHSLGFVFIGKTTDKIRAYSYTIIYLGQDLVMYKLWECNNNITLVRNGQIVYTGKLTKIKDLDIISNIIHSDEPNL